ncbi:hypothetical protein B7486_57410, partial [cyanobacterium TDX16]
MTQRSRPCAGRAPRAVTALAAACLAGSSLVGIGVPMSPQRAEAGVAPPSFSDVSPSQVFFGHITWLAEEGITTGFPDGTYRPSAPISRGAMAAFLHRVAGEPGSTPPEVPTFSDVSVAHPFFEEVEWLAGEGITTGFGDGTFRPGAATSRQATAAYLHRFSGSPTFAQPTTATFSDVSVAHPFFDEVEWLVAEQVTTGFPDGGFHPTAAVSRQAMAAFVFRQQHLAPDLEVGVLAQGLNLPWDVATTPDGAVLFDEVTGAIRALRPGEDAPTGNLTDPALTGDLADFQPWGEAGMTGLVLDPDFESNRTFYTCQVDR